MKNAPWFHSSYLMFNDFQKFLELNQKKFGDFYRYKGLIDFYYIQDLSEVKKVLIGTNKEYSKNNKLVRNFHNAFGDSIIISEYEKWKPRRQLLNPSFTKKNSLSLFSLMKIKISETIEEIDALIDKDEIRIMDMYFIFNRLIIKIIGMAFFNKDLDEDTIHIERWLNNMKGYIEKPPIPFLSNPNALTSSNLKMKKNQKKLLGFVKNIIEERKSSDIKYNDLLGRILIETEKDPNMDLTGDELVMEILTLIVSGHETTANTLGWLLYFLTRNPLVYKKLQQEIDQAFDQEDPSSKEVMELEYLDCTIKETMRLVPAAWIFARKSKEEVVIHGEKIKKDATIISCPILIHRDQRLWEKPNSFIPERFLPKNKEKIHPDSYMPFGVGQRTCIGLHLAMIEMKVTLIMMLQKFEFIKNDNFEPEAVYSIATYPANGIKLGVKRKKL